MEYIKKEELQKAIQKFIDARKDKNCSKQTIIERTAFEYVLSVVNKLNVYEIKE